MGLFDRVTRFNRRALTGGPAAPSPSAHAAWMSEEIKAYASVQQYAGPHQADMNVTGETPEMARAYRTMLKEPAIVAPLLAKTYAVAALDPQVTPEDEDDPVQKEAAAFVNWSVRRSTGGWPRLLMNILLPGQIDGYSVTEKVFTTVEAWHPKYANFWTLAAAKDKDTRGIRLKLDPYRNVLAVQALTAGQGGKPLDPRDFILYSHLSIFQSPFGLSVLRPCYRLFNLIGAAIKLRSILLENFAGPFLSLKLKDQSRLPATQAALAQARSMGYIVIDTDDQVEVMNLATSAPDQFQQSIEDFRKEASLALRGAYLQSLESSSPQGDSKTHKTQTELFDWYLLTSVCSVLQDQLVPDLVGNNFGGKGGRPEVTLGGIDPSAVLTELDKFAKTKALGVDLSKRQIRRLSGADAPMDDGDTIAGDGGSPPPGPGGPPGGPPVPGGSPGGAATAGFSDGPDVAAFAAKWSAATGKAGQPGFVSDGGQFRVQLPKGARMNGGEAAKPNAPEPAAPPTAAAPAAAPSKKEAAAATQAEGIAKVRAAFAEPHKLTAASAAELSGHLSALSAVQLKGLAAELSLTAGKTKAAAAGAITAKAAALAAPATPKAEPPAGASKAGAPGGRVAAVLADLTDPAKLTPERLASLPADLARMTVPELRATQTALGDEGRGVKADRVAAITARAKAAAISAPDGSDPAFGRHTIDSVPEYSPDHDGSGRSPPAAVVDHAAGAIAKMDRATENAVVGYTGLTYRSINTQMRTCPPDFGCLDEVAKSQVDAIEGAIAAAGPLPKPVHVFRGLGMESAEASALMDTFRAAQSGGGPVTLPSLTSTSFLRAEATSSGRKTGDRVTFYIRAKTGLYVESITMEHGEQELLMSSKSRYTVANVVTAGKSHLVELAEV